MSFQLNGIQSFFKILQIYKHALTLYNIYVIRKGEVHNMRVNYKGMDVDYPYRIAEINYDDEKECKKIEYIAKVMYIKGWEIKIVADGWAYCEVDNIEEYKSFMKDWKEVKKSVALWRKFGFAEY